VAVADQVAKESNGPVKRAGVKDVERPMASVGVNEQEATTAWGDAGRLVCVAGRRVCELPHRPIETDPPQPPMRPEKVGVGSAPLRLGLPTTGRRDYTRGNLRCALARTQGAPAAKTAGPRRAGACRALRFGQGRLKRRASPAPRQVVLVREHHGNPRRLAAGRTDDLKDEAVV
jgi:hypothetical protein